MDNQKIYDFMQMMYKEFKGDITEMKGDITELKEGQAKLENRQEQLEKNQIEQLKTKTGLEMKQKKDFQELKDNFLVLENEQKEKFNSLFDSHTQTNARLERIENKIDVIDSKVDMHETNFRALKIIK